ncbi:ankyrin repeat-containing domain protein [Leptodontidium sp. MPI-SDFR-AT-0119]|nr:ankyrin repeat-containing domain protein [Leptodontidium sp. MPI-SDFR-AT-0119]
MKSQHAVDTLLSKPEVTVDIRGTGEDRLSSLELAAHLGCSGDTARILLSRTSIDFSALDPVYGNSILHWTTGNASDTSVLKELLQRKVDLECLNKASVTALYTAISWENAAVVNILLEAGANVKTATGSPLKVLPIHQAVQTGQLQVLRKLIEYGADINATSADTQWTALHYACLESQLDMISFLIASGALLNKRDAEGNTPYLIAAGSKNWHVVHKFFTTSADLEAKNLKGLNALHFAILYGSVATLLKDYGANLDTKSRRDEQTPLHIAAKWGYLQNVIALLEAGCSPNLTDAHGMTPELLAIENGHDEVVKILSQNLDKLEANLEEVEGKSSGSIIPAVGTKFWKLPLSKSPHVVDVMKEGNMTIYAVRDGEGSEEIRKTLGDNEGEDDICLGKPYRRRI